MGLNPPSSARLFISFYPKHWCTCTLLKLICVCVSVWTVSQSGWVKHRLLSILHQLIVELCSTCIQYCMYYSDTASGQPGPLMNSDCCYGDRGTKRRRLVLPCLKEIKEKKQSGRASLHISVKWRSRKQLLASAQR